MILTGSCSWTEESLILSGEFYPKGMRTAEERLRFYAAEFCTVEVDSSYYALPDRRNTALWAERTPEDFIFHIKAYGALTGHAVVPKTLTADIVRLLPDGEKGEGHIFIKEKHLLAAVAERFTEALSPLKEAEKLGVIVFQFPPWFSYKTQNLDYILTCKELLGGLDLAVEFRHGSWLTPQTRDSVFTFLRDHKLVYVAADEPQYGSLATVPFVPEVTADIAYFRFHGRNRENWLRKGIKTSLRYDYLYSPDEVKELAVPVLRAVRKAKTVYAMFNNCHGASAIRNARQMKEMVDKGVS